jgi:hypothetical protein
MGLSDAPGYAETAWLSGSDVPGVTLERTRCPPGAHQHALPSEATCSISNVLGERTGSRLPAVPRAGGSRHRSASGVVAAGPPELGHPNPIVGVLVRVVDGPDRGYRPTKIAKLRDVEGREWRPAALRHRDVTLERLQKGIDALDVRGMVAWELHDRGVRKPLAQYIDHSLVQFGRDVPSHEENGTSDVDKLVNGTI